MAPASKKSPSAVRSDRRRLQRHRLCLDTQARTDSGPSVALVHDLSQVGFLMESDRIFAVGEPFRLELEGNDVAVRVVWSCGRHFGCEFDTPISRASLSGALLKARPAARADALPRNISPVGTATPEAAPIGRAFILGVALSLPLWIGAAAIVLNLR